MRVLMINRLAGIAWGGGEAFDLEVARALRELGHDVRFVIGRRLSRLDLPLTEFPTACVRTPYLRWMNYSLESSSFRPLRTLGRRASLLDLYLFERAALRCITDSNLTNQTDVYQLSGLPRLGAWLRRASGKPTVVAWHGPPATRMRRWAEKCSASIAFGDTLPAVCRNADSRVVEVLPGVDTESFKRSPERTLRERYNIPQDGVVALFVGRMVSIKNIPLLINAFATAVEENSKLHLLLVGDGASEGSLRAQVKSMRIDDFVHFAGRQGGKDLQSHYSAADMFVLASSYESFSFVVLEALACELPVIAPDVGVISTLVEHGKTGWVIPGENEDALTSAILNAAKEAPLLREMGREGRKHVVQTYAWLKTARNMVRLYEELL